MRATYLFTLDPEGAFRASGGENGGAPLFHSDTLMAALRSVAEETGLAGEVFPAFPPSFTVSSVFPEVGGVRLYPRPLRAPEALEPSASKGNLAREAFGELEFVTEARLESLAEGRRVRFEREDIVEERVWGMPSERSLRGLPVRRPLGGILVDRAGGEITRFTRETVKLPPGGRAFFVARFENPALLSPFRALVMRLGESGLGGGRSVGSGQFALASSHPAPAFLADDGRDETGAAPPLLLLSLYLPAREEVERGVLAGAAAGLSVRGGWIHSGGPTAFRKRSVRMLVEGTVLRGAAGGIAGEVSDVTPPGFDRHPVWRDGRAFAIAYRGAG